jgi:hypothetical protein
MDKDHAGTRRQGLALIRSVCKIFLVFLVCVRGVLDVPNVTSSSWRLLNDLLTESLQQSANFVVYAVICDAFEATHDVLHSNAFT